MKTNNPTASKSTELTDATETTELTHNSDNTMQSDNTPTAINTAKSDNLFNDEQPTPDAPIPPKQQRVGKQQRRSDFADFKETYLMPSKLTKRHSINIEESVWEQLERVARILGDRGSNVGSYINAILSEHLKTYASDIELWRKL